MTPREELILFARTVFGADVTSRGLYCEGCKTQHPEGGELFFIHMGEKQIAECCFFKKLGPLKNQIDARRTWFLEYLLQEFRKNPLHPDWDYIRSVILPSTINDWKKIASKEKIVADQCAESVPQDK